jgi:hypothetical protein
LECGAALRAALEHRGLKLRITCSVVVVVLGSAPALAEDLPRFDIQGFCAASAGVRGDLASCQRAEETKRVDIAARWESFPKQRKHFCVQSVTFRKKDARSYTALAECLDERKTS